MNLTQGQLSKASPQIWFERGEAKDRKLVVQVSRASHLHSNFLTSIDAEAEGAC